jgi:adenylate kinase family enzyme
MKIAVIGSGGSGKTTFSVILGDYLSVPAYHLDEFYWKPGWVRTPNDEWDSFQNDLVRKDEWIIDGNYESTLDIRLDASDTVIFYDISPCICLYRVVKRYVKYRGKTRPDLNERCPESMDLEFLKWIMDFRKTKRPKILEKLRECNDHKRVIILRTPGGAKRLLKDIKDRTCERILS